MKHYKIEIILSKDITIKDVRVCSTKIGNQGLEMIIGMDIIMLGDFAISNLNNEPVHFLHWFFVVSKMLKSEKTYAL